MTQRELKMKPKELIPEFKSRQEEAEFWGSYDMADYWDEWQPVKVRFARNLSEGLTIRLDPETLKEVRTRAKTMGIGPTTLIRMWVLERIRNAETLGG